MTRVPGYTVSVPDCADDAGLETTKEMLPGERNDGWGGNSGTEEAVLVAISSVVVAVIVSTSEDISTGVEVETGGVGTTFLLGALVGMGVGAGAGVSIGTGAGEIVRSSAGVGLRNRFSIVSQKELACACVAKTGVNDAPSIKSAKNDFFIDVSTIYQS